MSKAQDNPNEFMVGIEEYIGEKLEWSQNNQGIILPIESLRIIHDYLESVNTVYQIGRQTSDTETVILVLTTKKEK